MRRPRGRSRPGPPATDGGSRRPTRRWPAGGPRPGPGAVEPPGRGADAPPSRVRRGSPGRARSPPEAGQGRGVAGPEQRLDIAPEGEGLEPESDKDVRLGFVEHPPVTGGTETDLGARPREIDQVDAVSAERVHHIQQERVDVDAASSEIADVPVRLLPRFGASPR